MEKIIKTERLILRQFRDTDYALLSCDEIKGVK